MIEIYDVAAVVILGCLAVCWRVLPPLDSAPARWSVFGIIVIVGLIVRITAGALSALDLISAAMLVYLSLVVGRELFIRHRWPEGMFIITIAVLAAVGVYLRADRFELVIHSPERQLQPDVRYYLQQASETANPFAAGWKSPLWSAMHAPLVRCMQNRHLAIRVLSWFFGILMIPLTAITLGRLFEPVVGVLVAGLLAVDSWLIDLCCEGLREEFGLCLWMIVLLLLFGVPKVRWQRVIAIGLAGGVLLLLRNIAVVPLIVMIAWAMIDKRWSWKQALAGLFLSIAIVSPFYINQWRTHGDPFAMEKRDARYHANLEFNQTTAPPGLSMPSSEELKNNLYAGEPISPLAYLVKYHSPTDFAIKQWHGLKHTFLGEPFHHQAGLWLRLICAAGLIATLLCKQQRFAFLFVFFSTIGIRAHLLAVNQLDQRLLIPVMVIWLSAGAWIFVTAIRAGATKWINRTQTTL